MVTISDEDLSSISAALGYIQYEVSKFLRDSLDEKPDYFKCSELQSHIHSSCERVRSLLSIGRFLYNS